MERREISKLFSGVRKKYDKPMQVLHGAKVRFMVPCLLQETLSQDIRTKSSRSRTVMFQCLPYFCLEKYSGSLSGLRSSSHPMRTLLQQRFSLVQKDRDMQQAVCQLLDTPTEHCFHIAQMWCLVLDDCKPSFGRISELSLKSPALLVTCARTSMNTLQGGSISIISEPTRGNLEAAPPSLLVSIEEKQGKRLWSFRLDECQTWFVSTSTIRVF